MDENTRNRQRYAQAAHAMQSGVATEIGLDNPALPDEWQRRLKHLRVGINSAMVEHSALAALLIEKGVIAEADYLQRLADAMEVEARRYEVLLSERMNTRVRLL